ncbi:hypothetical protein QBC35DRAFT_456883 [Podospora australis]|uniref:Uncharacterized protein n=1 Tax=Podospora australis TaxID=1536484 RepID=A0AAN7AEG0_9PEZI|nr:hypothetical protein QBC35DRAFT_456883 [Podospora australis]
MIAQEKVLEFENKSHYVTVVTGKSMRNCALSSSSSFSRQSELFDEGHGTTNVVFRIHVPMASSATQRKDRLAEAAEASAEVVPMAPAVDKTMPDPTDSTIPTDDSCRLGTHGHDAPTRADSGTDHAVVQIPDTVTRSPPVQSQNFVEEEGQASGLVTDEWDKNKIKEDERSNTTSQVAAQRKPRWPLSRTQLGRFRISKAAAKFSS